MTIPIDHIEAQLKTLGAQKKLDEWNPETSGEIDIHIKANGEWFHEGSKIERQGLITLFSSILRRETDGHFYLVTPVEKWRIQVEDAPLIVTKIDALHPGTNQQAIQFTLNNGDYGTINSQYKLWVETTSETHEPAPYIALPHGLHAKLNRSSFYHLIDYAVEEGQQMKVYSDSHWFILGKTA